MPTGLGQICLFDLGNFQTTDTVDIFSNTDGYQNAFLQDISVSLMTPPNCPFFLNNIPPDTETIYLVSQDSDSCIYLNIISSDLCETCNFGFSQYSATSIGRIFVGSLTADCQSDITDYVISWYNQEGVEVITSGEGTLFNYEYLQPALGTSGPFVPPGTYYPIISQISLSGQTFDLSLSGISFSSGITNGFVWSSLDCLPTIEIVVDPFKCEIPNDPNTPNVGYDHNVAFIGASSNPPSIPDVMPVYLDLENGTNYVAYAFRGVTVIDQIKVVYSGVNYDQPFILDWFSVGSQELTNFSSFPTPIALQSTQYLKKVICLTGFTNIDYENDQIIFEILPNQTNVNTDWYLSFECMNSFNCDFCFSGSPKISTNDLSFTIQFNPCGLQVGFNHKYSGCSTEIYQNNQILNYFQKGIINVGGIVPYTQSKPGYVLPLPNSTTNLVQFSTPFLSWSGVGQNVSISELNTACASPNGDTNTVSKVYDSGSGISTIFMNFETVNSFNTYYNSYITARSMLSGNYTNNQEETYYETYKLFVPQNSNPNLNCGDQTTFKTFVIPKQAVFTTGQTQSSYTLQIVWTGITNGLPVNDCFYIPVATTIGSINSTLITNNVTIATNTGSRSILPFTSYGYEVLPTITESSGSHYFTTHRSLFETIPRNYDNTSIIYPQYSAVTCPNLYNLQPYGTNYRTSSYSWLRTSLLDTSDPVAHKLEKYVDGTGWVTVYNFSANTFNDVNYTYAY
jgi:hypothetical protein